MDQIDSTITNLYCDFIDQTHPELVSAPTGAVVQTLDRLEFPNGVNIGQDGYTYDTGLIAAVNQVIYGDESDPDTYPGVIASGDKVFIGPPLLRRVQVSVAVRQVAGADVASSVQAAIASVINSGGGQPIIISNYIAAAQNVPGVISVVPISPVPITGADTIPVQPGEKAVILDINTDVQVSIVGS